MKQASQVLVARGKKLLEFDMKKSPPTDDELLKGVIGPSGNLRAPTIVVGKTVLVGYHEDAYQQVFG